MGNFTTYANELQGYFPKMSVFLAQTMVNRAYRDIKESRHWTFLLLEGVLTAPGLVSTGSVTVTQYSRSVVGDVTAKTAWNALAHPVISQRQFRVAGGPIYSIVGYDNNGTITLDREYQEGSALTASYQIYQCYYQAPVSDFLRWVSLVDPVNGQWIRLNFTRHEIDKIDPQRTSFGNPSRIVAYKTSVSATGNINDPNANVPVFELWPHPQGAIGYQYILQRRGQDLASPRDSVPPAIPEDVLMLKARAYAYEWAEANKGRLPELHGSDYRFLLSQSLKQYHDKLSQAQRQDEETFLQNYIPPERQRSLVAQQDRDLVY